MSYSRWGASRWYTFWDTCSGATRDSQAFTLCDMEADSTVLYADMADADKREAWLNEVADKATNGTKYIELEDDSLMVVTELTEYCDPSEDSNWETTRPCACVVLAVLDKDHWRGA